MPNISTLSRLSNSVYYSANNGTEDIEFWGLPVFVRVDPAADDVLYRVTNSDTIDGIATQFLDDPVMWDVIAEANEFRDLPSDLRPNDLIRVPSQSRVLTDIRK